jgi:HEAT repeat protein
VRIRKLKWAILAMAVSGSLPARGAAQDGPIPLDAESLIANLKAPKVALRRDAANKLRTSEENVQRKALPVMIDLLMKEKDGQVRLAILDAVTALRHEAAPAVPALIHTLRTNYGGQRQEEAHQDYRSALALAAVGKPAVDGLRSLLAEQKDNVRAEAVMALGRIGPDAAPAATDLVGLLGDKNERIGREVSLALGRIGTAAVGPLVAASADKNVTIRARAAESLGYLPAPDEQASRAVIKCTQDANTEVRAAAVKSLARLALPAETCLPILKASLRDEDEGVRLAAVDLLVSRRALLASMAPELESLLTAKHQGVAGHAAFLLGEIGPEAAPRLLDALGRPNSPIGPIGAALAHIGRPIVALLAQALERPEPRVRSGAALALGQIRPLAPGTAQKLAAGLRDPDPQVKTAFLTALGYLGPRAREAVPAVRALLNDASPEIRVQAVDLLFQSAPRDDHLLGDLTVRLDDADARVQKHAIDAIRSMGPPGRRALDAIIGKLRSTDPDVRVAAAEFIGSHGQAGAAAVPALCSLLDDSSPRLRILAAQTLGKLGKEAQPAFARLTPLLAAEQVELREAATSTLGGLGLDAEVIRPHLAKALRDDKAEVRRAAVRAIQRLGAEGAIFVPDLILMSEKSENVRLVARLLRRFERSGPEARSLPELIKQLDHKQDRVRLLAIKFLGLAGGRAKEAIPALERMREDPSAEVRKQAAAAGELIKNNSPPISRSAPPTRSFSTARDCRTPPALVRAGLISLVA